MINMIKLEFVPLCAEWIYSAGDAIAVIAVSSQDTNKICIYDAQGTSTALHVFEKLHTKPVVSMKVKFIILVYLKISHMDIAFLILNICLVFYYSIILSMKHVYQLIRQVY